MTEIPTIIPFEEKLKSFNSENISNISPLEINPREAAAMKTELKDAGCNMEIDEMAETFLLFSHQFKNLNERRGIGVAAVLGGEKAQRLMDWCLEKGREGGSGKIGGHEGTEGRGLMQAAADLITIAYFADRKEGKIALKNKTLRLNQRIKRGFERQYGRRDVLTKVPMPDRPGEIASIPPGSLSELWQFLITE